MAEEKDASRSSPAVAAGHTTSIRVLGPLTVTIDGIDQPLGGPRQRAVLGLLALEPNRSVSVDRIIVELWDDDRLRQPRNNVQVYVSNLRRILRPAGTDASIVADGAGYRLQVVDGVIDYENFTSALADARRLLERGLAAKAADTASAALALWHGPFLDDLAVQFDAFSAAADRAEEQRLFGTELMIGARIEAGHAPDVIGELERLTSRHPVHERFWAQLMTALHRAGRPADALRAYQRARTVLAEEAGLDPGPELRELESMLLSGDAPAADASDGMHLLYTDALGNARRVPLVPGAAYTIGRAPSAEVAIEWDAKASRTHAQVEHRGEGWYVRDLGSTNGTSVGGRRIDGDTEIRPGDVFVVGATAFALRDGIHSHRPEWSSTESTVIEPSIGGRP